MCEARICHLQHIIIIPSKKLHLKTISLFTILSIIHKLPLCPWSIFGAYFATNNHHYNHHANKRIASAINEINNEPIPTALSVRIETPAKWIPSEFLTDNNFVTVRIYSWSCPCDRYSLWWYAFTNCRMTALKKESFTYAVAIAVNQIIPKYTTTAKTRLKNYLLWQIFLVGSTKWNRIKRWQYQKETGWHDSTSNHSTILSFLLGRWIKLSPILFNLWVFCFQYLHMSA